MDVFTRSTTAFSPGSRLVILNHFKSNHSSSWANKTWRLSHFINEPHLVQGWVLEGGEAKNKVVLKAIRLLSSQITSPFHVISAETARFTHARTDSFVWKSRTNAEEAAASTRQPPLTVFNQQSWQRYLEKVKCYIFL